MMAQKILYIEDDMESQSLMEEVLTDHGYDVILACDGHTGYDTILSAKPDLVICDIIMPEVSGFEIIEMLSKERAGSIAATPFIFLTALDDKDSILRGRRAGADEYLIKPIDFDILIEIVKRRLAPADRSIESFPVQLSTREEEVLTWVARGKSSSDIGSILGISEKTVEYHIHKILHKFNVSTRVQAAIAATKAKLIRP